MPGKEYLKLILLTLLILTVTLMPFNGGLKIQKAQGVFGDFGLTDYLSHQTGLVACEATGKSKADCKAAEDEADKKMQDLLGATCRPIFGSKICDFLASLAAPAATVAAMTAFYTAVCTPETQVPIGSAGSVTGLGNGGGPGLNVIASLCDSMKRALNNAIKNELLGKLQNDILDWIERGGTGPVIVNNWGEFLNTAADDALGGVVQDLGGNFLCSPIKLQVQLTLQRPQRFQRQVTCTLSGIVNNIQDFYGDFKKGDWLAYQTQWQPQNNYYGATLIALDEAAKREYEAKIAAQNEGLAGGGYLSKKDCVTVTLPGGGTAENCQISSPGSLVGNAAAEVLVKSPIGAVLSQEELAGFLDTIINAAVNKIISSSIDNLKAGLQRKQ